jgi:hypothetical protein
MKAIEKAEKFYDNNKDKKEDILAFLVKAFLWNDLVMQIQQAKKVVTECKMLSVKTKKDISAAQYLGQENAYDQVLHFMQILERNERLDEYAKFAALSPNYEVMPQLPDEIDLTELHMEDLSKENVLLKLYHGYNNLVAYLKSKDGKK